MQFNFKILTYSSQLNCVMIILLTTLEEQSGLQCVKNLIFYWLFLFCEGWQYLDMLHVVSIYFQIQIVSFYFYSCFLSHVTVNIRLLGSKICIEEVLYYIEIS